LPPQEVESSFAARSRSAKVSKTRAFLEQVRRILARPRPAGPEVGFSSKAHAKPSERPFFLSTLAAKNCDGLQLAAKNCDGSLVVTAS